MSPRLKQQLRAPWRTPLPGLDPTVVSSGAIWGETITKPAEKLNLSPNLGRLRHGSSIPDSAVFRVANVCRKSKIYRDMICDSLFRRPLIEMAPDDTTVESRRIWHTGKP